jgi:hypothetical protein
MFVHIREPMVSPKISEKACQMEIVTEMQKLRGPVTLLSKVAKDSAGSDSALVKNPSHHAKPCPVNLEAGRKEPSSTYKPGQNSSVQTVISNCFDSGLALVRLVITNKVYRSFFGIPAGGRRDSN